jgi:hypothetical protein
MFVLRVHSNITLPAVTSSIPVPPADLNFLLDNNSIQIIDNAGDTLADSEG